MATLQNIRNRGKLLAIIIGIALLAFLFGGFLKSGSTFFQQSQRVVADIDGETIDIMDFNKSVDNMVEVYKIEMGRNNFNELEMAQIRNSVWESTINERLLKIETDKIGISVSKEELTDRLIGNNIHPLIKQRAAFIDPQTGMFSVEHLRSFYNNVFSSDNNNNKELEQAKNYWLFWEKQVKNSILQEKFSKLIINSVSANSLEAKYNFDARDLTANVNYILQPYYAVPDSSVKVTDADLKKEYNKNREQLKQENNRTLEYVGFEVKPLEADFAEAKKWMDKIEPEFRKTADEDVAVLVNQESDVTYTGENLSKQTVPANLKEFAFSNNTGAIYGPIFENDTYTMARIMKSGIMEADSVKLRHIAMEAGNDEKADSIIKAIRGGADFAKLAAKYSLVKQTAANGGEIGWITKAAVGEKEITDPAFAKSTNDIFKVSNPQSVQIFQIMAKTPARPKVRLAIMERKVTPSNESYSKIYNDAKQFAVAATTADKFTSTAKDKGYAIRTAANLLENGESINNIPQSRQVIRWAFENEKNRVSDVFDCDRALFVVAMVTEINEKGYIPMEKVKSQLRAEVIRNKKADKMVADITKLQSTDKTLETLSQALNLTIKNAPMVNFGSYQFGDSGFEPAVIGKVSVLADNKVSEPIVGSGGVYVIQTVSSVKDKAVFNKNLEVEQLNSRVVRSLPYLIIEKLKEKYEVKDNRSRFY